MKRLFSFVFVLGLIMVTVTSVKADTMTLKSIETIMTEIRTEQGITSTDPIDISKVTSARLEELGDSVMEKVIGNTATHDRIDITLGGDGSKSLTAVHVKVGYDYLIGIPITMMTFMGGRGMMGGYGYINRGDVSEITGMMSDAGWAWMFTGLLGLILLVFIIIHFMKKSSNQQAHLINSSALSILNERYAKGEVSHEEYSKMRDVLK